MSFSSEDPYPSACPTLDHTVHTNSVILEVSNNGMNKCLNTMLLVYHYFWPEHVEKSFYEGIQNLRRIPHVPITKLFTMLFIWCEWARAVMG